MLENSSSSLPRKPHPVYFWHCLAVVAWLLFGFVLASLVTVLLSELLPLVGVSLEGVNEAVFSAVLAGVVYVLSAAIVIGIPQATRRFRTTWHELGLSRLPVGRDLLAAPAAFVAYFIVTSLVTTIAAQVIPGFDLDEAQDVGFANLTQRYEYVIAFLTLVVLAPVAEEVLFRGYLYGRLRRWVPIWVAALITSVVFGVVHGQWNVGVDVFVLSLVMCGLREWTGSIWAGILLHMLKNGLAFYILFINPTLLNTIGG